MGRSSRRDRGPRGFELVMVGLMALGAVVFIEPAPFDLLAILLFPLALVLRELALPRHSAALLIIAALFVVANVVSLVPARDLSHALRFFAITAYLMVAWLFVFGYCGKHGERAMRMIMLGWTWGATLTTALAILAFFRVLPLYELLVPGGRMHGFFKDPNVLGAFLVAPAVWSTSRLLTLERGQRIWWALALIVCSVGILLTFSRGAWISLALAMFAFFVLRLVGYGSQRSRIMTLLMVPVALILLAIALERLANVDAIQDMLARRFGVQDYDVDRFATQREALELAAREPIGIGPGQSEATFTRAAHNAYVRGFVENGYVGGLALIALMFSALFNALWVALSSREPRRQVAMAVVAASLAAICVESIVIDTVHWRHMWVLMGMAWAPAAAARAGPATKPKQAS